MNRYEIADAERTAHIEMHVNPERGYFGCGCGACRFELANIKETNMDNIATAIAEAVRDLDEAEREFISRALDVRYFKDKLAVAEAHEKNAHRYYVDCKRTLEQLKREPGTPDSETLSAGERNPSLR